jgi:ribosomal protein L21E
MRIVDRTSQRIFAIGAEVRFKAEYLISHPDRNKRFSGRVGKVTGYRMGASEPIVEFQQDGRRKFVKLFEVSNRSIELVS